MRLNMKRLFVVISLLFVAIFIMWHLFILIYPRNKQSYAKLDTSIWTNSSWKHKPRNVASKHHDDLCPGGVCHPKHKHSGQRFRGLSTVGDQFYLNGKPFRILGGSFHYFRTQPHQWIDRLERLKAAGLNTVTTYIPWNLHERTKGKYNFHGRWKLLTFIKLVWKMDLYMIIRPGPFICAEWDLGGLPAWLLHDPNMQVRTSKYPPFLQHVEHYFNQLLPRLSELTYSNGGPIIGFQVENEFGNYGPDDAYMKFLVGLYMKHGIREMYFTSDNAFSPERLERGSLAGVLATVNFNDHPLQALERLKKFQPNRPLMVMEFWPGWFDTWGRSHNTMSGTKFFKAVDTILSMNASVNFYMFIGGTNFGFWNGASYDGTDVFRFLPTTTSYDYDALVSESGSYHPTKYKALRLLLIKHKLVSTPLPQIPPNPPKGVYDTVPIKELIRMDEFVKFLRHKPVWLSRPVFMEHLNISNHSGQAFGWILYRSTFEFGNTISIDGAVHNRAHVFVNGRLAKIVYNELMRNVSENVLVEFELMNNKQNTLEILVENMGRVNGWMLAEQRRGFEGKVTAGGRVLSVWEHMALDFSDEFVASVARSAHWKPYSEQYYPSLYRGFLNVRHLHDTFLDMKLWTKGIVIVNGYNLGRYWNVGPQQTLYIPKPLLKKARNEIVVFELEKPANKLNFVAEPILDSVTNLV